MAVEYQNIVDYGQSIIQRGRYFLESNPLDYSNFHATYRSYLVFVNDVISGLLILLAHCPEECLPRGFDVCIPDIEDQTLSEVQQKEKEILCRDWYYEIGVAKFSGITLPQYYRCSVTAEKGYVRCSFILDKKEEE